MGIGIVLLASGRRRGPGQWPLIGLYLVILSIFDIIPLTSIADAGPSQTAESIQLLVAPTAMVVLLWLLISQGWADARVSSIALLFKGVLGIEALIWLTDFTRMVHIFTVRLLQLPLFWW
jgi:hypothetical protein